MVQGSLPPSQAFGGGGRISRKKCNIRIFDGLKGLEDSAHPTEVLHVSRQSAVRSRSRARIKCRRRRRAAAGFLCDILAAISPKTAYCSAFSAAPLHRFHWVRTQASSRTRHAKIWNCQAGQCLAL